MKTQFSSYGFLALAILCEVGGTTFLQKSEQFTRLLPSVMTATLYACAFYFLTHALKVLPLGIAYGIWSGLGIVLIAGVGYFAFNQKLDTAAMIGIGLIIAGVVVVQVFSKTMSH